MEQMAVLGVAIFRFIYAHKQALGLLAIAVLASYVMKQFVPQIPADRQTIRV
jgi:hypothetical protein